jgi:23S rRNA (uracil1939-C5)-methyltransferase
LSVRNPLVSQAAPEHHSEPAASTDTGKRSKRDKRREKRAADQAVQAPIEIDSLDMEARGVGRTVTETGEPGKVIFVEGALPGERVTYSSYRRKPSFEQAQVVEVLRESVIRTTPRCRFFGTCGGCSMQHLDVRAQIAVKQRVLEDNLQHLAKLRAETVFRPIHGPSWGYRYRARLTVRNVPKKGGVLVGFHERKSSYVADMTSCEVLPPHVSAMLVPLRQLVEGLSIRDRMPQIELAVGSTVTALVLRILEPLNAADEALLRAVLAPAEGAGYGFPVLSARCAAGLHAAGIRHPDAVQADGLHAGQPPDQSRAGGPRAATARAGKGRPRARSVLRNRQLHAAARAACA